jgi:hypothetical protein
MRRKAAIDTKLANAKKTLERTELERRMKQSICNHTQGGEGLDGLFIGDGLQTTYQKETSSLGDESFRCIRCDHVVTKKDNPKEFRRINMLPHKGLKGPIPVTFRFVDLKAEAVTE